MAHFRLKVFKLCLSSYLIYLVKKLIKVLCEGLKFMHRREYDLLDWSIALHLNCKSECCLEDLDDGNLRFLHSHDCFSSFANSESCIILVFQLLDELNFNRHWIFVGDTWIIFCLESVRCRADSRSSHLLLLAIRTKISPVFLLWDDRDTSTIAHIFFIKLIEGSHFLLLNNDCWIAKTSSAFFIRADLLEDILID